MSRPILTLLAAVVCLVDLVCGCVVLGSDDDERRASVTRFLPDDARCVIVADVSGILSHPLVDEYYRPRLQRLLDRSHPSFELLLDQFGFDPLNNISMVVLSARTLGREPERCLLVLHGRFQDRIFREGFLRAVMNGKARIYRVPIGDRTCEVYEFPAFQSVGFFWAMANAETVIVSSEKALVVDALLKAAGQKTTQLQNERFQTILTVADTNWLVWMVLLGDALVREDGNSLAQQGFEAFRGGAKLDDGFSMEMVASVVDTDEVEKQAQSLRIQLVSEGGDDVRLAGRPGRISRLQGSQRHDQQDGER